jgi:DNA-binding Lrp family transcriptional regulator
MHAYVLIQTHSEVGRIAEDLRTVPGVILAEDLSGPYDAIALASSESSGRFDGVIAEIRDVPGVARALSAPLLHSSKELRDGEAA